MQIQRVPRMRRPRSVSTSTWGPEVGWVRAGRTPSSLAWASEASEAVTRAYRLVSGVGSMDIRTS